MIWHFKQQKSVNISLKSIQMSSRKIGNGVEQSNTIAMDTQPLIRNEVTNTDAKVKGHWSSFLSQ